MMLRTILSLPDDIIRDSLVSFLELTGLVRLDTATLCKESRPRLLEAVFHNVLLSESKICYGRDLVAWLLERKMFVHWLDFEADARDADLAFATPLLQKCIGLTVPHGCDITNEALQTTFRSFHTLEEVLFDICTLNDETIVSLADNHPKLHSFRAINCTRVTDMSMIHLAKRCPSLYRLQLDDCTHLTDASFEALAAHCQPSDVYIAGCVNVTNISLQKIALKSASKLRVIDFSGIPRLSGALFALAQHCPGLDHLFLNSCRDMDEAGLMAVISTCQALKVIELEDSELSYDALLHISTHISSVLTDLQLFRSPEMTDEVLIPLLKRVPKLEALYINNCFITDASLLAMADLYKLCELDLQACPLVTTEGIRAVVRGCTLLGLLDLSNCTQVGDDSMEEIAQHCSALKILGLFGAPAITSAGILSLSARVHTLEDVNFAYLTISDESVLTLMENCPSLYDVSLEGKEQVSKECLRYAYQHGIRLLYGVHPDFKSSAHFVEDEEVSH